MNEFGIMEVVDEDENVKPDKNGNIGDKENVCFTKISSKSSPPTVNNNTSLEKKGEQENNVFSRCIKCHK